MTADLTIHPLAALAPEWTRDDEQFKVFVEDVRDRDIDQPLIIDDEDRILDGRARWRAARLLQIEELNCLICAPEEVAGVIINSLLQRRHFSKGALAYITFPLLTGAHEEALRRRIKHLKMGQNPRESAQWTNVKTVEEFSDKCGFGRTMFFQAREIHSAFKKTPGIKVLFEPRILSGEMGLGACLAGIAGKEATDGKARGAIKQLELFKDAFDTLKTRFAYWKNFQPAQRENLREKITSTVETMPADLRDEFEAAIKAAKKKGAS